MSVHTDTKPKKKTRWRQISLATLLLLITVAAFAISHFLTSRDLATTKSELNEYRYQYGDLVVEDPDKIHLLKFADEQNPWKWHAHFPKGKQFRIVSGVGVFGPNETPDVDKLKNCGEMTVIGTGELTTFSVKIAEPNPNSVEISVMHNGGSVSHGMPKTDVPWYTPMQSTTRSVGYKDAHVGSKDKPTVIFWTRKPKVLKGGMVTVEQNPTEGIVVIAVPVK